MLAGKLQGVRNYRADFWKRMAFVCRYGHTDLVVAMGIPSKDLNEFMEAVGQLITEENKNPGAGD
jgi:hypothetical protein